jgi:hypothetical protein
MSPVFLTKMHVRSRPAYLILNLNTVTLHAFASYLQIRYLVLKHRQSLVFPQCEAKFHIHIKE